MQQQANERNLKSESTQNPYRNKDISKFENTYIKDVVGIEHLSYKGEGARFLLRNAKYEFQKKNDSEP